MKQYNELDTRITEKWHAKIWV